MMLAIETAVDVSAERFSTEARTSALRERCPILLGCAEDPLGRRSSVRSSSTMHEVVGVTTRIYTDAGVQLVRYNMKRSQQMVSVYAKSQTHLAFIFCLARWPFVVSCVVCSTFFARFLRLLFD